MKWVPGGFKNLKYSTTQNFSLENPLDLFVIQFKNLEKLTVDSCSNESNPARHHFHACLKRAYSKHHPPPTKNVKAKFVPVFCKNRPNHAHTHHIRSYGHWSNGNK